MAAEAIGLIGVGLGGSALGTQLLQHGYGVVCCDIDPVKSAARGGMAVETPVAVAERWAAGGVRELGLVSQDSVRYGADLYGRPQLVRLLGALAAVEGIEWLR